MESILYYYDDETVSLQAFSHNDFIVLYYMFPFVLMFCKLENCWTVIKNNACRKTR